MVFDQEHINISNKIAGELGIPVEEVIKVIKDFTTKTKDALAEAVHNKELPDNYKLTIPNCFSFYSMKGRLRINKSKRLEKELSNETVVV